MVLYDVHWKELKNLDKQIIKRLLENITQLAENPRPLTCKKLQGADNLYRVRVGDYRVVFSIDDKVLIIEIIRVGHRRKIYQSKFD